jgi:threonine/homoserine/homoserine lactone efflux protein
LTGLGATTIHAAYGTAAVIGGEAAGKCLHDHASTMHGMGGLLLGLVGLFMLKRTFAPPSPQERYGSFVADYASAVMIAASNPITLAMFVAGMSAFETEKANPMEMVLGVVLGSSSWYVMMCLFISAVGSRLPIRIMQRINRMAALAVCAMGAAVVIDVLFSV